MKSILVYQIATTLQLGHFQANFHIAALFLVSIFIVIVVVVVVTIIIAVVIVIMVAACQRTAQIIFDALAVNHNLGVLAQVDIQSEDRINAGIPFVFLAFDMNMQNLVETILAEAGGEFQMMQSGFVLQSPVNLLVMLVKLGARRSKITGIRAGDKDRVKNGILHGIDDYKSVKDSVADGINHDYGVNRGINDCINHDNSVNSGVGNGIMYNRGVINGVGGRITVRIGDKHGVMNENCFRWRRAGRGGHAAAGAVQRAGAV